MSDNLTTSCYLTLGLALALFLSWRRFDEPAFKQRGILPHTDNPLFYMFIGPTYNIARVIYLASSIIIYSALVLYFHSYVAPKLWPWDKTSVHEWSLVVVLALVGLSSNRWIGIIDRFARRFVHRCFLVPNGVVRTVDILAKATYKPSADILEEAELSWKQRFRTNLDLTKDKCSLEYRWARLTLIFEHLRKKRSQSFKPFSEDFEDIRRRYKSIQLELEEFWGASERTVAKSILEEDIVYSIDNLSKQIYAYISWGLRQRAKTEKEVDAILREELGFHIPPMGSRDLLNVVVPATTSVGLITFLFWFVHDLVSRGLHNVSWQETVPTATSAIIAGLMYGLAVFFAVKGRSRWIESTSAGQSHLKRFAPVALQAGLASWGIIGAVTVFWFPDSSLAWFGQAWDDLINGSWAHMSGIMTQGYVPRKAAEAIPWSIAGAAAGALLAGLLGGDARRVSGRDRLRDSIYLGVGLGVAVAIAQAIQFTIRSRFGDIILDPVMQACVVGLAGFVVGVVIGSTVPQAYKANILMPLSPETASNLEILLECAEARFGNSGGGRKWAFEPKSELGGVSPAEAIQFETRVFQVWELLGCEPPNCDPKPSLSPIQSGSVMMPA